VFFSDRIKLLDGEIVYFFVCVIIMSLQIAKELC